MPPTVRALTPADADAYSALRREMLLDTPFAFLSAPGDDRAAEPANLRASLADPAENAIYAAIDPTHPARLLSVAGLYREKRTKTRHRAGIWGVYTTPSARGGGLARRVVAACVEHARSWPGVSVISLSVSTRTPNAQRAYESLGFRAWGMQPDYLCIDGASADEVHMQLAL